MGVTKMLKINMNELLDKKYPIKNGIVKALENSTKTIKKEIIGWNELAHDEQWINPSKDYLRHLPNPCLGDVPKNDNFSWKKHSNEFFNDLVHLKLKGKLVLDLAAGRCWTTKELVKRGANCIATDIMVEFGVGLETAKVYDEKFGLVQCDMNNMPFNSNMFDMVYSYASMHHSEDLGKTIDECYRVLKPGGLLVLSGEPCDSLYGPFVRKFLHNKFIHDYGLNETWPHYVVWLIHLENAGFKVVKYPEIEFKRLFTGGNMFLIAQKPKPRGVCHGK